MTRNRAPTLADYLVIAISPALIMLLVGSLVFFLMTAFYDGAYDGRLRYIAALFVFAAVLIGRISISEGTEYAAAFAVPLGIAVWLTLGRFTDASSLFILLILGITWWSAHKLTWDCTLLDEADEAVGEGLLKAAGFDSDSPAVDQGDGNPRQESRANVTEPPNKEDIDRPGIVRWWNQWVANRRRPHAPGVWIIYYALATLPLFGIGQWAIPGSDVVARRSAFHCLLVYVASALALMGATSFLGIRRYLRHRSLEMPIEMGVVWAGASALLILGILFFCTLLPRPAPEYSLTSNVGSPDGNRAHRFAWLRKDGAEDDRDDRAAGRGKQQPDGELETPSPDSQDPPDDRSDDSKQEEDGNSADETSDAQGGASESGDQPGDSNNDRSQSGNDGGSDDGNRDSGESKGDSKGESKGDSKGESKESDQARDSRQDDGDGSPSDSPPEQKNDSSGSTGGNGPQSILQSLAAGLRSLTKLVYWLVIVGAIVYFGWRHRSAILRAIVQFVADMKKLFGRNRDSQETADVEVTPSVSRKAFASFEDPFRSRKQLNDVDLVRYTFQALEAWAREHACPRHEAATPFEFAKRLAAKFPSMSATTSHLVQTYDRLAYAGSAVKSTISREHIRQLWRQMLQAG